MRILHISILQPDLNGNIIIKTILIRIIILIIQTDEILKYRQPDIAVLGKKKRSSELFFFTPCR